MKVKETDIKKIAVFRALQLGDMLCAVPAFRALRAAYPQAHITLLGLPWAQAFVARFHRYFDAFKHFPGYPGLPEQEVDVKAFAQFLVEMQHEKYDLILQMQGNGSIVNPMVALFGGRYTAGFCISGDYCPDKELFLEYPEGIHEIERHLALMNFLRLPCSDTQLEFPLTEKDVADFEALPFELKAHQYVCIHPGSRGSWRQWPPDYFAALGNYCTDAGFAVVITGTQEEIDLVNSVAQHLKKTPLIAAGKTSLGAVGVLIKRAALIISNCTGVSHMAAAFQTPSVVISMDGEPERWAPLNKTVHRTIDWTKTPDFNLARNELKDLMLQCTQRNQLRDERAFA